MIVCSNCQHANMAGAVFCSECGSPLESSDTATTQNSNTSQTMESYRQRSVLVTPPPLTLNKWVTLHILDTGEVLPLAERDEFTLGRISEGQSIMPDVDLSPYHAYAGGVSRLHAVIKRQASRVFLMDLGSANGSYVNGKRLDPNVEHPLTNGDVVALGKLKIQVLLKAD